MEVLHYIADAHLRNLIRYQWHILLLLYIHVSGLDAAIPAPGTEHLLPSLPNPVMDNCSVSTVQTCPCNSTGYYCAGIDPALREIPAVHLLNITHLDFTHNAIEKIESGCFLGLEFLDTLCLGDNLIDFIDANAFSNLYRLETLNLENNQLTSLDPSGRTFQHLASLKYLYLQNNKITNINKYSFFTMATFSSRVVVNLENNPTQCDCDVWELRQRRQDFSRVSINLICANSNHISYLEVAESTFGSCNDSTDGVFSGEILCPICVDVGTNKECHKHGLAVCSTMIPKVVCHKTVKWNSSNNKMALSSSCVSYESCITQEANNAQTCGLDFQTNTSVACNFCCRGTTCNDTSIGGRTTDFTFYVSFYAHVPSPEMIININNTISDQITSNFSDIVGGIDGILFSSTYQGNQSYRFVLQLFLTTFNTMTRKSISSSLENDVDNLARALHIEPNTVSVTTYFEGLECHMPAETCPANMSCLTDKHETMRCLCNSSSFYLNSARACSPVARLQVKNINVSTTTTTSVNLTWTVEKQRTNVDYTVHAIHNGDLVSSSSETVVPGLDPGTEYNFTIISTLKARFYERITETSILGVWTKATHGSTCDPLAAAAGGNTCAGENIQCVAAPDGRHRCLCASDYYLGTSNNCRNVSELRVTNLRASSSNDTITLTFVANEHGTNVSYKVRPSPYKGQVVANSTTTSGAKWGGLDPGTLYNFTVISTLPETIFDVEKNVSSEVISIWTKFAHGMKCNASTDICATDLSCLQGLDGRTRCLCNDTYFYSTPSKTCLPMTKLQVSKLNVSLSTDISVSFTWTANKFWTNVTYTIWPSPFMGQVVASSDSESGAIWTGLNSGTQYNFTVTATLKTDYYSRSINTSIYGIWTKAVHGNSCDATASTNGRTCIGSHIQCLHKSEDMAYCLCSSGYYFSPDNNTCRDVNELLVRNLNVSSITNDTVTFSWTVDKHGTNVAYIIEPSPYMGHVVANSVSIHGGKWTGLYPGIQYNFNVTSVLPPDDFYGEITVASQGLTIWTKVNRNVTILISYVKQDANASFQHIMSNSSSHEYKMEEQRIITGVTAVLAKVVDVVSVQLLQFRSINNAEYQVDLLAELTTFDAETIRQVLNEAIRNNTQDTGGFFYKEQIISVNMSINDTGTIDARKCQYSLTSFNKGGILWNEADVGIQYSPCPYNNPLDHPMAVAERICLDVENGLPVWGEVNASLCITKEESKKPNILDVFERNITKGNAGVASDYLKMITNSSANLTVEMILKSVTLLEILTTDEMLQLENVATNVIDCVSNLINVNVETLQQSETATNVSSRLLDIIDSVANKAPLTKGKLKITSRNLAVAAQTINSTEMRDITLVTAADAGNEQTDINIDVSVGSSSQVHNTTSMVIPVSALLESLNSEKKRNLNRIAFTVHRSDILFSVIRSSGNRETPRKDDDDDYHNRNYEDENRQNGSYIIISKINSNVVSASVPGVKVENLSSNITMNFEHANINATNARCVFWDEKGDWSDTGCGVVKSESGRTTCGCNHLTNFALLMDVYEQGSKLSALDRKILSIISYVGCGISCFALLITLITYSLFKKLRRDNPAKILINLCLALLCSNLVFLLGMQEYSFGNIVSCKAVAVLLHYFLLASLTWMAVEAFYMYLALVVVFKTYYTHFILKCSVVGWGVPLLVVIITLAVNKTDNYGLIDSGLCWLKNPAFYAAFVGPVCFILLINCMAFILVVKQLASMSSVRLHKTERNSTIQRLRGAVGVVILLGLSWIFAIFAIGQASVAFYYLFAICNSLQGLFIFIFYCLLKSDAILSLKRSLPCFEEYGDSTKSYSHSKGATNTATGHHLMEHKSGSPRNKDNSQGTVSTTLDSRKDSCFSTLSDSNTVGDKGRDVRSINTSMVNSTKATSRLLQSSEDIAEGTSNISSDKPMRYFSGIRQDPDTRNTSADSATEQRDTNFCQYQPTATRDSYNIATSPTDEPQQRADGEIDCSHLASVSDILNKLENIQFANTDIDNNLVTTAQQSSQDTGEDTSSYLPTNSDKPTRYSNGIRQDPVERYTSTEELAERQDTSFCEHQPEVSSDYISNILMSPTDDSLPRLTPSPLSLSQPADLDSLPRLTPSPLSLSQPADLDSLQLESPESSFPCSPDHTPQTDEQLNPSFTPFRADGEIDYSHLASVSDVQRKFEWLMSETSDKNVTKI